MQAPRKAEKCPRVQQFHSGYLSEENEQTNLKRYVHLHATSALLTTAKIWEQPKCPRVSGWIRRVWSVCVMERYSAVKRMKSCHLQLHDWTVMHYAK